MARKQKHTEPTFAETVAALPRRPQVSFEQRVWLSPIADGEYVDELGATWELRGGTLPVRRVEKLLVDPLVPVIHVYVDNVSEVPPEERDEFLAKIRPYLKGIQAPNDYADYHAGEFKDESGRSLLVIEEFC